MYVHGEANDYVAKGMHGGLVVVKPPANSNYVAGDSAIIGNTCLYGATGGRLFAQGRAGERFAVRNSGAETVIEGAGDHCCEYMTAGTVVVLGSTGRNIGAGMTGGLGYFYDPDGELLANVNYDIVSVQRLPTFAAKEQLRGLIEMHTRETGSQIGARILANFDAEAANFWQVVPPAEADRAETRVEPQVVVEAAIAR
ncbi:alpha subunit of glutamate synthase [Pavlovales sp. CCMP2436]|nr:alpha subunit of glutamate synthase [Pavlovales sp. CCMP2436]